MSGVVDLPPINTERRRDPFGDEAKAPVVPRSMADSIQPDTNIPPAGHSRDEFMRQRRDRLEAQISEMPADMAGGMDVSEVPIENEIAQAFDEMGNLPVSKMKPEYVYKWKKADDKQVATAQRLGFEVISGDPREDKTCNNWEGVEYIGKGPAAGTTLRGSGDVLLFRMRRHRYEQLEEYFRRLGIDKGQVEANFEAYGEDMASRGLIPKNLAHGRPDNPLIMRVFQNGGPDQARNMNSMLRAGRVPGATVDDIYRR